MNKLEDYIQIFDNILDPIFCQELINEYFYDKWEKATTRSGHNPAVRSCSGICISDNESLDKNYEARYNIVNTIFNATTECLEKYSTIFKYFHVDQNTGFDLLKYEKNQFYKQHVDTFIRSPRSLTASYFLNSDYEGGYMNFFDRQIQIKPKVGSVLMFPSNFMYPHEVSLITKGIRYSIVTWFK
jgi:predicted 2-oxoglutarate/Fe(II)-dependent dioxygenase YbiX